MKIKKTVLFMGYNCNNNCIFCCNGEKRNKIKDKNLDEIKKDLVVFKQEGSNYLELIGGEPTIRKDIFKIVAFAKKLNFATIMFATNGRMFSNKEFAKKIIGEGVNQIIFSIHGDTAELHDKLTQVPGSFEQLMKGIKNLNDLGFKNIGSNTTIVKQNYLNLEGVGELIYSLGIRNSEFIFVDPPYGISKKSFFEIVPKYSEVSPYICKLLKFGASKNLENWYVRYYPLCFIDSKFHNMVSELHEVEAFETMHVAPDFINKNVTGSRKEISRIKTDFCRLCEFYDKCEGVWKEYLNRFGVGRVNEELEIRKKLLLKDSHNN